MCIDDAGTVGGRYPAPSCIFLVLQEETHAAEPRQRRLVGAGVVALADLSPHNVNPAHPAAVVQIDHS